MSNKKIAVLVSVFIAVFLLIALGMGVLSRIPFLGKVFAFLLAGLLIVFVVSFFLLAGRKK